MSPQEVIFQLAKQFIDRVKTQKIAESTADKNAVEFFCGASALASVMTGQEALAQRLRQVTLLLVCTQGVAGVRKIIKNYNGPGAETAAD